MNLNDALATVREKIKGHRAIYEQSEAGVRAQLIEPVLRSLGWDPEDPEQVRPNVSRIRVSQTIA